MGTFITPYSPIFKDLNNTITTIALADTNVLLINSINITNIGPAPIRFNLIKSRTEGITKRFCYGATTADLPTIIYNNGSAGVGATITNNSVTLTAFSIDGLFPVVNSRILVKNQATTYQNGIYTLTTVGSNSIPWVLTRATDYNKVPQINSGDLIYITNGTLNGTLTFKETATITAIGTSPIIFIKNIPSEIALINELEIKPYVNVNVICSTGILTLEYNPRPFTSDKLVCFSNGYTQLFNCNVEIIQLNELPIP
jgi:hypothetical protein